MKWRSEPDKPGNWLRWDPEYRAHMVPEYLAFRLVDYDFRAVG